MRGGTWKTSRKNYKNYKLHQPSFPLEMGSKKLKLSAKHALGYQSANKDRRKQFHIKQKQARDSIKRQDRFQRKKEEDKNPHLRKERLKQNVPHTIDSKRKWDDAIGEDADSILGLAVNVSQLYKRRKEEELKKVIEDENNDATDFDGFEDDSDAASEADSMLDGDDDEEEVQSIDGKEDTVDEAISTVGLDDLEPPRNREHSLTASVTSTRLDITPEALLAKFPTLFDPPEIPKVSNSFFNSTSLSTCSNLTSLLLVPILKCVRFLLPHHSTVPFTNKDNFSPHCFHIVHTSDGQPIGLPINTLCEK